jgi:hypothetical protein
MDEDGSSIGSGSRGDGRGSVDRTQLRVASALAHALPRSLVELVFHDGRVARVSHDAAFRPLMSPCALRHAVRAWLSGALPRPGWLDLVADVRFGGPLIDHDGCGLYRTWFANQEVACFATLTHPDVVRELVEGFTHPAVPDAAFHGRVCPDVDLAVTLVAIEVRLPRFAPLAGSIARTLQGRCLAEELVDEVITAATIE